MALKAYEYTSDTGKKFFVKMESDNASQLGFIELAFGIDYPKIDAKHCRVVNFKGIGAENSKFKRRFPIPLPASPFLARGAKITLKVSTGGKGSPALPVSFVSTGRRGEKLTY